MTIYKPGNVVLGTGRRYAGMTIDQIAQTDRGLLYLDRLLGYLPKSWAVYYHIKAYLADPAIAFELDSILESQER